MAPIPVTVIEWRFWNLPDSHTSGNTASVNYGMVWYVHILWDGTSIPLNGFRAESGTSRVLFAFSRSSATADVTTAQLIADPIKHTV